MNTIEQIFSSELIRSLGWSLVHSLWQGAILIVLFALLLVFMHKYTSRTRYFLSMSILFLFLFSFIITFSIIYHKEKQNIDEPYRSIISNGEATNETLILEEDQLNSENSTKELISNKEEESSKYSIKQFFSSFRMYYNQHLPFIVTVWLLGVLLLTLKLLGGLAYAQRLKKYKVFAVSGFWQQRFKELTSRFGFKKKITCLESAIAKVPQAIGYVKPVILLPVSLFSGLSTEQIESIILHELAHIYRKDYLFNILQSVVEILFFFHPAVWWISSVIREERENCCDDIAVELSGDRVTYAKTLVEIEELQHMPVEVAMALSGRKGNKLFNRIKRISLHPKKYANFSEGFVTACVIFLSLFIIGFSARASVKKMSTVITENYVEEITDDISENQTIVPDSIYHYSMDFSLTDKIIKDTSKVKKKKADKEEEPELVIRQADSIVLLTEDFANVEVQKEDGQTSIVITANPKVKEEVEVEQEVRAEVREEDRKPVVRHTYINTGGKLWRAVEDNDFIEVERLLSEGANPNEGNKEGYTPLIIASKKGRYSIAKLLLEYGADIELAQGEGYTPLNFAVRENKFGMVSILIEYGANVNAKTYKGWTSLMEAGDEDYAIMKMLIENGAEINAKTYEGWTPLMEAVKCNRYENTKLLLDNGANVNDKTYNGYTALMEAADEQYEISVLLIQHGIDVNASQYNGWTALYNVIKNDRIDLVKLLLKNGADTSSPSYKNKTPYEYAREMRRYDIARLIKSHL